MDKKSHNQWVLASLKYGTIYLKSCNKNYRTQSLNHSRKLKCQLHMSYSIEKRKLSFPSKNKCNGTDRHVVKVCFIRKPDICRHQICQRVFWLSYEENWAEDKIKPQCLQQHWDSPSGGLKLVCPFRVIACWSKQARPLHSCISYGM